MSLYLPSLIYLHGAFSLRIFAVSMKNTPKILSIVFGCVTGSNVFGSRIQYLGHPKKKIRSFGDLVSVVLADASPATAALFSMVA